MKVTGISALAISCAFALGTFSPQARAEAKPGPCAEGICEYSLKNGLKVLLFPDPSKPDAIVNVVYNVGSVNENYGESGMAHLLEHMLFKGTPAHAGIPEEMKKRGITYNALTAYDSTNYFGYFPANEATLDWLLQLEADRMVNSFIARKDLDSEMTVVRNEMEKRENDPGNILRERLYSTAFLWHNYGKSTIGARSDVENVPIERLQAFYRTWYRPDNATVVVAGKFDGKRTLAQIEKLFGGIKNPVQPLPRQYTVEPTQDGERTALLRRSGDVQIAGVGYHIPASIHPDAAALKLLGDIMSNSANGRLYKRLVETKIAAGAGIGPDGLRDPGIMLAYIATGKDSDLAKSEAALLKEIEGIPAEPVTQKELDDSKLRFAANYDRRAENVVETGAGLTAPIVAGDWRLFFLERDAVAAVTLADVNRVAARYFKPSNRTVVRFVPDAKPDRVDIQPAPAVAELLKGYKGKAALAEGEDFEATTANIQKRTETFRIGTGLKVNLLPKETRGDAVVVTGKFRFAGLDDIRGRDKDALAGALLMNGSATMNKEQIVRRLTELKAQGGVSGAAQGAALELSARRDSVIDALKLLADVLRNPSIPETELETFRNQVLVTLEAQGNEPAFRANDAMSRHFNVWPKGHPLAYKTLAESIATFKAMNAKDLRQFHRDFFGTDDGEITVVGDFDPVSMKAALTELFGNWKTPKPYSPITTKFTSIAPVTEKINTPDKANAVVTARLNLSLNTQDPDYIPLVIANYILGGGGMKSRLMDRLRQKEGITYGISTTLKGDESRTGRDDDGSLAVQGITAPENAEQLVKGIREELTRLVKDGITEAELKDAVDGILVQRRGALGADRSIADILQDNAYFGWDMTHFEKRTGLYRDATVSQVNAALKRNIKPETLSVFMAGDFEKAAKK